MLLAESKHVPKEVMQILSNRNPYDKSYDYSYLGSAFAYLP